MRRGGSARGGWLASIRHYLAVSALAHLLWESAQLPLYTIWHNAGGATLTYAVLHCTAGDMIIAAMALMVALVTLGSQRWPEEGAMRVGVIVLGCGVAYVVYSEYVNTVVRHTWAYTSAMPTIPWLGTGLAPVTQWFVVPTLALLAACRPTRMQCAAKKAQTSR